MPTANRMRQMTLATAARIVVRRPRPVNTGGIHPAVDEMTVERHLHHLVTVGTRHGADATIAGRRLHLALAETTIDGMTVEVVTAVIVASRRPLLPGGIVGAATRSRGPHLVRVRVLRHTERTHGTGTGTVLVITTAEEMIHGTGTGIAAVDEDEDLYSWRVSALRVRVMCFCLICPSPYS